jgi:hypothetical protein
MKKSWALLLVSVVIATGWTSQAEAAVVVVDQPGVVLNSRQSLPVVVVDSNGNTFQQTVYYDPSLGGIDLNTSWAGPNASVYFPTLNTGYVWYNGYWVNPAGYYWNGGRRYYVGPTWNNYWVGYWNGRNHWNGVWYGGHGGDWHGGYWHGGDWHGGGWHGDNWHGGDWHGGNWHGGDWHGGGWHGGHEGGGSWHGGHGGGGHGGGGHHR